MNRTQQLDATRMEISNTPAKTPQKQKMVALNAPNSEEIKRHLIHLVEEFSRTSSSATKREIDQGLQMLERRPHVNSLKDQILAFDTKKVDKDATENLRRTKKGLFGEDSPDKKIEKRERPMMSPSHTPEKKLGQPQSLNNSSKKKKEILDILAHKVIEEKDNTSEAREEKRITNPMLTQIHNGFKLRSKSKNEPVIESQPPIRPPNILMDSIKNGVKLKPSSSRVEAPPIKKPQSLLGQLAEQFAKTRKHLKPDEPEEVTSEFDDEEEGGGRKKQPLSKWITHVIKYWKNHGGSYKEAMIKAKSSYTK